MYEQRISASQIGLGHLSPVLTAFVRDCEALLQSSTEAHERTLANRLFSLGSEIREGKRSWTKSDINTIIQWKKLQPLRRRIEQASTEPEKQIALALAQSQDEDRLGILCRIPGFGPVLACAVLTLTWPESYGILNNPSWRALALLGFELPPRPYSGGGFTVAEALRYQKIIRALGRMMGKSPDQVANALYSLHRVRNRNLRS
jgi:hypothetical protein